MLYAAIGTFYNPVQKRAFPRLDMLEAICPLSRYSRSRALRELLTLGLVEVWGEKRGRRRRTVYRLPYVNEKRWHMAHPQQATGDELQDLIAKNQLPADLEWAGRGWVILNSIHKRATILPPTCVAETATKAAVFLADFATILPPHPYVRVNL
jgi:hypothetical protein